MIEGIKVFGERNSGNNYIMHLLDKNLDLKYTTREPKINKCMGWTHGKVHECYHKEAPDKILFLFIFKNPYSWLLSFKEKTHTNQSFKKTNFFGFLQTPVEGYNNPVLMLMDKYKDYLAFSSKYIDHIKYEEALETPEKFITGLCNQVNEISDGNIIPKGVFVPVTQQTHPSSRLLDKPFDKKEYYLKEQWKAKLGTREIAFINEHLDFDVMEKLGYKWI